MVLGLPFKVDSCSGSQEIHCFYGTQIFISLQTPPVACSIQSTTSHRISL